MRYQALDRTFSSSLLKVYYAGFSSGTFGFAESNSASLVCWAVWVVSLVGFGSLHPEYWGPLAANSYDTLAAVTGNISCWFLSVEKLFVLAHWNFSPNTFGLTDDGENDDDEVEDVPADGEEVISQCHDLDEALDGEDDDEGQVDVVQDVLHLRRLLVRLHHHGDHVEEDQHHDDDVEHLLPRQVEEETLHRVLEGDEKSDLFLLLTNVCVQFCLFVAVSWCLFTAGGTVLFHRLTQIVVLCLTTLCEASRQRFVFSLKNKLLFV